MTWHEQNNKLEKDFAFDNFMQAVDFVNAIAKIAEDMQHHPDIFIHDYKHVRVQTTTHDAGKVTGKDHVLAEKIDAI